MKQTMHIIALAFAALFAPVGRATANAGDPPTKPPVKPDGNPDADKPKDNSAAQIAELQKALADQAEQIKELKAAKAAPAADAPQVNSEVAMLCKGAGISTEDVLWRIRGGLSAKQAVDAAVAQIASDKVEAENARKAKKAA